MSIRDARKFSTIGETSLGQNSMISTKRDYCVLGPNYFQNKSQVSYKSVKDYIEDKKDDILLEPTYQLSPVRGKPNISLLRKHVQDIVDLRTEYYHYSGNYSPMRAKTRCRIFADQIKNIIKPQVDSRYRVLVVVNIGQNIGQSLSMKSGFLWDHGLDTWFSVQKEVYDNSEHGGKNAVFCVINVFLVYKE